MLPPKVTFSASMVTLPSWLRLVVTLAKRALRKAMVVLTAWAAGCAPDLQQQLLGTSPMRFEFHMAPASCITGTVANAEGWPHLRAYL